MTKETYRDLRPGGMVANEPFPQALYKLAKLRGYQSQRRLGLALGHETNGRVSVWYRGESAPTPDNFGALLRLLEPTDDELDGLVEPYGRLIAQGWGEAEFSRSEKSKKPAETTLGRTIDEICHRQQMTLQDWSLKIGFSKPYVQSLRVRRKTLPSVSTLTEFLEKSLQTLELNEREIDSLVAGVSEFIEQRVNQGRGKGWVSPRRIRKLQTQTPCQTYLPIDVAKELGLERQRIHQIKKELGISNVILTEDDRQQIITYHNNHHK